MQTSADFLHIPYTADLTEGGIAYALRSLSYGGTTYSHIQRMVAAVAVALTFRRILTQKNIPYEIVNAAPFTDRDRHDVLLSGQRCDIKSFLISDREQINNMRRDPNLILNAPALVPSDIDSAEGHPDKDLYIFAFVTGLKATTQNEIKKIPGVNESHYFMHIMPEKWRMPYHWNPLGILVLKSEADAEITVEISGQTEGREFLTRIVNIPPMRRILVNDPFYSISALRIKNYPAARLGIVIQKETHIIAPADWKNIWVYGMDIILAGFITRGEFRQRANFIPANSRVFQYDHTRIKNLAIPISSLKPLKDLFARTLP